MVNLKRLVSTAIVALLLTGMIGCGGVSEEQLAELDALRAEVKSLEKEVNALKSEKTKLEREIAGHQAKLDQCARDKAETEANLKKLSSKN